ncbi:MAG TPA: glutathione peroxidase [Pseudohaliea sp.]|nr:glutathione peroxidase [Pseudohaliea sp.]
MSETVYDFTCTDAGGKPVDLGEYRGKVLLVVNTASKCGFTPQFAGLEALYEDLSAKDFAVLGFPCNQFGSQDPGSNDEIVEFCQLNYGVSFPMFGKIAVNGAHTDPLFAHLKAEAPGALGSQRIKWNFTKFLVNRDGEVVRRYAPTTKPEDLRRDIEALLQQGAEAGP